MQILKEGNISNSAKIFKCEKCGCVFEADKDEREITNCWITPPEPEPIFYYICPTCGYKIDAKKGDAHYKVQVKISFETVDKTELDAIIRRFNRAKNVIINVTKEE